MPPDRIAEPLEPAVLLELERREYAITWLRVDEPVARARSPACRRA
jgi:hypothetical protein